MLEKLRSKPEHIKKSISLFLTIIIFSGILFVWVSSWDARTRGDEIRDKTVSPVIGVTSMFDGFVAGFKEKISGTPSFVEMNGVTAGTEPITATSTDSFDISGVVILDGSTATSTLKIR
ncbi:MAG: hypothetical protein HZB12_00190 [Candidatus Yonathbacteria bacterium]|nr:hypothetical protein [Candidatus Yonathbacteria bacterium]